MTPIDPRIQAAGLKVSLDLLVTVFVDHWRGIPARSVCAACGHRYLADDDQADCPTNTLVRPMLYHRRNENRNAVYRLTPEQWSDLKTHHTPPLAYRQPPSLHAQDELFSLNPTRAGAPR